LLIQPLKDLSKAIKKVYYLAVSTLILNRWWVALPTAQWWYGVSNQMLDHSGLLVTKVQSTQLQCLHQEILLYLVPKMKLLESGITQLKGSPKWSRATLPQSGPFRFHKTEHFCFQDQMTRCSKFSSCKTANLCLV
jgi:hypothetical protein